MLCFGLFFSTSFLVSSLSACASQFVMGFLHVSVFLITTESWRSVLPAMVQLLVYHYSSTGPYYPLLTFLHLTFASFPVVPSFSVDPFSLSLSIPGDYCVGQLHVHSVISSCFYVGDLFFRSPCGSPRLSTCNAVFPVYLWILLPGNLDFLSVTQLYLIGYASLYLFYGPLGFLHICYDWNVLLRAKPELFFQECFYVFSQGLFAILLAF